MAAVIVAVNGFVGYLLWQTELPGLRRLVGAIGGILALEMVAGISLAYLGLPAFVQPIHLTLATLLFGAQFLALLALRRLAVAVG